MLAHWRDNQVAYVTCRDPGMAACSKEIELRRRPEDVAGAKCPFGSRFGLLCPRAGRAESEFPGPKNVDRLLESGLRGPEHEHGIPAGELSDGQRLDGCKIHHGVVPARRLSLSSL